MRRALVDQRDLRLATLAKLVAQTRHHWQTARTAADHDDAVPGSIGIAPRADALRPIVHAVARHRKAWCTRESRKSSARVCAVISVPCGERNSVGSSRKLRKLVEK